MKIIRLLPIRPFVFSGVRETQARPSCLRGAAGVIDFGMSYSVWAWVGFGAFILLMLSLDLGLINRKAHAVGFREAGIWSAIWIALALLFGGGVFWKLGDTKGLEFLTGYIIELSLSVDNLFVILLIFSYFNVEAKYQHRVLFWGVLGALVMRVTMIFIGAYFIQRFEWILYIFGAFLVYTGLKMFGGKEEKIEPERNPIVRLVTRFFPIARRYEGENFFTRENGRRSGTLLFLVLVIVEVTDLVFAVDSIPAIFAVTTDAFIVYTSNVFAILGLRSLFFLLAGSIDKFHYLKNGLAVVLTFIGAKMLSEIADLHIPIYISLGVVLLTLLASIVASLIWRPKPDAAAKPSG